MSSSKLRKSELLSSSNYTMQPGPGMPYVRAAKNNELKVERLNLSAVNDANSQYIGLDLSSDSESNKSSLDDLE